jgi:hypothetical protein
LWYRVFGLSEAAVEPAALLEYLHGLGLDAAGHFRGDEQGWFHAQLTPPGEAPVELERYHAGEEGIRDELNTWAAWLETHEDNPHHGPLMRHMIGTRQVFTLQQHEEGEDTANLCLALCRYLARQTEGVYQADGRGYFSAEGTLLVSEA